MGKGRNSVQPLTKQLNLQSSEFDEEFKQLHENLDVSIQR